MMFDKTTPQLVKKSQELQRKSRYFRMAAGRAKTAKSAIWRLEVAEKATKRQVKIERKLEKKGVVVR